MTDGEIVATALLVWAVGALGLTTLSGYLRGKQALWEHHAIHQNGFLIATWPISIPFGLVILAEVQTVSYLYTLGERAGRKSTNKRNKVGTLNDRQH